MPRWPAPERPGSTAIASVAFSALPVLGVAWVEYYPVVVQAVPVHVRALQSQVKEDSSGRLPVHKGNDAVSGRVVVTQIYKVL